LFVSPFRPTHQNRRDPKKFIALFSMKKYFFKDISFIRIIHELGEYILKALSLIIDQQTSTLVKNIAYE
jgi:hypothetical protein